MKKKSFGTRFSILASIAMMVAMIGCAAPAPGGGGGGGKGGDAGDNFACLPHEIPVTYYTDNNENEVPVLTPGTGWNWYDCVLDGDSIPEVPCFTRNSGPPESNPEIPTARCGGNVVAPTATLTCTANGDTVVLTETNIQGTVTSATFNADGNTIGTVNATPFAITMVDVAPGTHTYNSRVSGPNGSSNTNSCIVTIGSVSDPVVTITAPVSNATETLNFPFMVTANVAPYSSTINNVTFSVNGNVICTVTALPYQCNINPAALGSLTVSATAHAANGRSGSANVTVNVVNGVGDPVVTITDPLDGHTVYVNEAFRVSATVAPYTAAINNVTFSVNGNVICTDTVLPYQCDIIPTALGNLTVTVTAHAGNGHTGSDTVTVVVITAPMDELGYRCTWQYGDGTRDYYQYTGTNMSDFNGAPSVYWQNNQPTICGSAANPCVFEGVFKASIIAGGKAYFQGYIPSGRIYTNTTPPTLIYTNPDPSFRTVEGWQSDWAITGHMVGNTVHYDSNIRPGTMSCQIARNGTMIGTAPVDPDYTDHGALFALDITNVTDPLGNNVDITLGARIDSDGDGYYDHCLPNQSCIADNCILYFNNPQTPNPCLNRPNPCENDTDNNGIMDGGTGCGF